MKQSTYWTSFLIILILLILILFVDYFKVIATPYDAIWWASIILIYMNLHGVEGTEEFKWISKRFSKPFKETYKYVFLFCATLTWVGGSAESIYLELQQSTPGGIGFLIGAMISIFLSPLLLTYLIRLVLPFLKKVHDKASK